MIKKYLDGIKEENPKYKLPAMALLLISLGVALFEGTPDSIRWIPSVIAMITLGSMGIAHMR